MPAVAPATRNQAELQGQARLVRDIRDPEWGFHSRETTSRGENQRELYRTPLGVDHGRVMKLVTEPVMQPVMQLAGRHGVMGGSTGLVGIMAALTVIPLLLAGCPGPTVPARTGCARDSDCKGARICSPEARCIEPPPGSAAHPRTGAVRDAGPETPAETVRQPGSPPFAMFGGNAQNTGQVSSPAPATRPQQVWSLTTGGPMVGSPSVGPDGTIYATSHDGKLYAVAADGAVNWTFATRDRVWSTPAVASDGTVYIGSDDDHLYAVHSADGTEKWRLRIGQCDPPMGFGPEGTRCDVDGGPTLGPDGTIYTGGDGVYAVWPDGTIRWKFATSEHVLTAPALAPPGTPEAGTVYAGCIDDAFYAIAPDGTKKWEIRTLRDIESPPAVAPDGTIYFGGDDDAVYAVAPDGTVKWKVITGADVRSSPAVAADGTIYVGSHDGQLYAIAPEGNVRWRFATADKIQGSPAVASNGVVLFGSQDDHLYAVSPQGSLLWYSSFDADVDSTPWVSSAGVIYVTSDDKTLRALAARP